MKNDRLRGAYRYTLTVKCERVADDDALILAHYPLSAFMTIKPDEDKELRNYILEELFRELTRRITNAWEEEE